MSVYIVSQGRVKNRELLDQYVAKALPTVTAYGGRIVAFDEDPEVIEGTADYPRTVILEFPSRDAFRKWYDSPDYQEVVGMRLEAAPGVFVVAEAFVPPE